MADLRKRFGKLMAAHRRKVGMTQEELAEAANISSDMVSKIEIGASGARFPVIERLAHALDVDPAELFTTEFPNGKLRKGEYLLLAERLAGLDEADLKRVAGVIDAALKMRS